MVTNSINRIIRPRDNKAILAPVLVVSDRNSRVISKFSNSLQQAIGTSFKFNMAFHPQTDGQSKKVIQILEVMLRACSLDFGGNWDKNLPLEEFSYNNSY